MSYSPLQLRFLRKGLTGDMDDVLTITPSTNGNLFNVRFVDGTKKKLAWGFTDSWDGVSEYLSQTFAVLPFDTDPFEGVQFNLPAFPSILVKVSDLKDDELMDPLWDMLDSVAKAWPETL